MTRKAKGTKESIGPGLGMISFELKSIHMFPCALAQGRNSGHHDRECKSKKRGLPFVAAPGRGGGGGVGGGRGGGGVEEEKEKKGKEEDMG